MRTLITTCLLFLLLACHATHATYSIVATDAEELLVGGAGCTCIPNSDVLNYLYVGVPGKGVLHTQARVDRGQHSSPAVQAAIDLLNFGVSSLNAVLDALYDLDPRGFYTRSNFFYVRDLRQYGVADFNGHAGFTGKDIDFYYRNVLRISGTVQEDAGGYVDNRFNYHAQGNIVLAETVDAMQRGFEGAAPMSGVTADACDMPGRLMAAMQAVSAGNLGDKRCLPYSSGTSAFLTIDKPAGGKLVHLNIIGDGSTEPIDELYSAFQAWREENPCPSDGPPVPQPTGEPIPPAPMPVSPPKPTPAPVTKPTLAPVIKPTPAPVAKDLSCPVLEGCFLENLNDGTKSLISGGGYQYTVAENPSYSIFCEVSSDDIDFVQFFYDGNYRSESVAPYYMGGDSGGNASGVYYLEECGTKMFQVSGSHDGSSCFSETFELEAVC